MKKQGFPCTRKKVYKEKLKIRAERLSQDLTRIVNTEEFSKFLEEQIIPYTQRKGVMYAPAERNNQIRLVIKLPAATTDEVIKRLPAEYNQYKIVYEKEDIPKFPKWVFELYK